MFVINIVAVISDLYVDVRAFFRQCSFFFSRTPTCRGCPSLGITGLHPYLGRGNSNAQSYSSKFIQRWMTQNGIELCPVVCVIPCSTHRCRRFGGTILVHALPEEVHNTFHRNVAIYIYIYIYIYTHEGWDFNSGKYLFKTDTKYIHVSKFYCPSM